MKTGNFIKLFIIGIVILSSPYLGLSQEKMVRSTESIEDAEWVKAMLSGKVDIGYVYDMYQAYYKTHTFEKNQYTRQFKRWLLDISRKVESTPEQDREYIAQYKKAHSNRSATWSPLGPIDWDHGAAGTSYAPGSAHMYTVEQSISNPDILYAGGANCGLWKTTDRGLNWTSATFGELASQVYAVEIDYSNANTVYCSNGKTIIKSIDGGANFSNTGSATFQALNMEVKDIKMLPGNNQILFACSNLGFYRTIDGGANWTQIASGDFREVEIHPTNTSIIYAVKSVDTGSSKFTRFLKSTNTGATLVETGTNWPTPGAGTEQQRTEIAISPHAPNKVFALLGGNNSISGSGLFGVYISSDEGNTWTLQCCDGDPMGPYTVSDPNILGYDKNGVHMQSQYTYDLSFAISPTNSDSIWTGGISPWLSTNGGASFTNVVNWDQGETSPKYVHADMHDINIYSHSGEIWIANDGGIFYSNNNGATFSRRVKGIMGTDFNGYGHGWWNGDIIVGGVNHNGTMIKEENVYNNGWLSTDGGDGNIGFVNPAKERQVYSQYDIKILQTNRTIKPPTRTFLNKPNGSSSYGTESELIFDPAYYEHWISGSGTNLFKTKDDGYTFEELHDFGVKVAKLEQCWSNTNYIYACTWPEWFGDKKVWRSSDGGHTFTDVTPPPSVTGSVPNWVPYDIAVADDDPLKIWALRTPLYGQDHYNGQVVFYSSNGGSTWQNISTPLMNNQAPSSIYYQKGSNDGIYVATRRSIYYKDNANAWSTYNTGLPAQIGTFKMEAYHRKQKLRAATNRSLWESPFFANSEVIAQPSTKTDTVLCYKDSVSFVDHSIVSDQGVTWIWSFPGGSPATSNLRNPNVLYNASGSYNVSLTVSDVNGSSSKTINNMVTITNGCDLDTVPGKAAKFTVNTDHGRIKPYNTYTNHFSVSLWIKPDSTQVGAAGIFMSSSGDGCGFNFKDNNQLGYHWNGGQWWWAGGPTVPANVWSHIVLVIAPESTTIYLNGVPYVNNVANNVAHLNLDFIIGRDRENTGRAFKGQIDELAVYNKALSIDEVRLLRHLTKVPGNFLIAYYQFNEMQGTVAYDKINQFHAQMAGTKVVSSAPVGGGKSYMINVTSPGVKDFVGTGVKISFPNTGQPSSLSLPNGNVVVSKINLLPHLPTSNQKIHRYWVINNYGSNQNFATLDSIQFSPSGAYTGCASSLLDLYKRGENAEGSTWASPIDVSDYIQGATESVVFSTGNNITNFGQYYMAPNPNDNPLIVSQKGNDGANSLRAVLSCAADGDTIRFAATIDSITLTAPLSISKNVFIIDGIGAKVVIKTDANEPGFSSATEIVKIEAGKTVSGQNLTFAQMNNSFAKPLIRNFGNLKLKDCTLKGIPPAVFKHEPGATYNSEGLVEVK
jgi:Concanavalin A-like lectin/glucanases superfamily/PKD domain